MEHEHIKNLANELTTKIVDSLSKVVGRALKKKWWESGVSFSGFILIVNFLVYIWCGLFNLVKYDGLILFTFLIFFLVGFILIIIENYIHEFPSQANKDKQANLKSK